MTVRVSWPWAVVSVCALLALLHSALGPPARRPTHATFLTTDGGGGGALAATRPGALAAATPGLFVRVRCVAHKISALCTCAHAPYARPVCLVCAARPVSDAGPIGAAVGSGGGGGAVFVASGEALAPAEVLEAARRVEELYSRQASARGRGRGKE